ncbi:response regulator [Candidatus Saccharibacteria bacterium]|nr:response regulator [Candidatus Saccharibacteria bacterium]
MAKLLLVEDDNNLREIYAARLGAEGYDIVTAVDGEDALAVAVKERPDLIVLDVMMPKISGFDVLDILRSTPETKDAKIMMMTALSQDSDRERGKQLGVDKYIVKSQVTLEDVVDHVAELLQQAAPPVFNTTPPEAAPINVPGLPVEATEPVVQAPVDIPVEIPQQFQPPSAIVENPSPEPVSSQPFTPVAPQAPAEPATLDSAVVQQQSAEPVAIPTLTHQPPLNVAPIDPPAQDQAVQEQAQTPSDNGAIATPPSAGQVFQPPAAASNDQSDQPQY